MKRWATKTTLAMGLALGMSAFSHAALAEPDLVIQAADSKVEFVGCEQGQPLATGRIVIRNEGNSVANLRGAGEFFRSFVAVYVPENIDLIEKDTRRSKIEPGEQRAITFTLGAGKVKKGRNYNGFDIAATGGGLPSDEDALLDDEDLARAVQQFLKSRGFNVGVDGDWGPGSKRALRLFQNSVGLPGGGEWNGETAEKIGDLLPGGGVEKEAGNVKDDQGRTKITVFAVVDPYNLIDETNERNNLLSYTGYLDCD
ncbi:MAG: peptidoglycan-binding protein [Alphaproteobacteria bacterium]|nr:peptidoglycan-binding protein [Alphaproteobacteria bacterium]